jgi:hypothetical protein
VDAVDAGAADGGGVAGGARRGEVDLAGMEAGMERATRGPGQYIIAGDAAKDTYNDIPAQMAETAFNTLVAIDHITGEQVAEWRGRIDHDLVAKRAFLAGLFLNEALCRSS